MTRTDGKICETGTPEKIFGNPENEATRRFVRTLRELDFRIESKDFDFIGASTEVRDFAERSGMPDTLKNNLLSVFEELFEMLIMSKPDGEHLDITAEYDPNAKTIRLTARFTGERFDPESDESMVPWRIIGLRTKSASVSYCPGEYPNIITAEI